MDPATRVALSIGLVIGVSACAVGPNYKKPIAPEPASFKEVPPPGSTLATEWGPATPQDDRLREKWWEAFGDPALNALEEQVASSNQTVAQAEAQFRAARAAIRGVRADLFPTVTAGAAPTVSRASQNRVETRGLATGATGATANVVTTGTTEDYALPVDFSYEVDLWGRVRRNVEASVATAQASLADVQTALLSTEAELAMDYFQLHGLDGQRQTLDSTVAAYEQALQLTINRYNQGVVAGSDVEQARTQLLTTRAQATDLAVARAEFEHAIAILVGKPPADVTIPDAAIDVAPPVIPLALPSELVERRPDVAATERRVAAANAQIGVAKAAFFPTLLLTADGGLGSSTLANLLTWPSRFWSLGPSLVATVFDGGKRRSATDQAIANYDASVAAYRQQTLTAFQDVEDNLGALRVLAEEANQQDEAVQSAERSLALANNRYQAGTTTYLEVITAQSAALADERTAVDVLTRRMTASVLLIKALGGGWTTATGLAFPQP